MNKIRAKRIKSDNRNEENSRSLNELIKKIKNREQSERKRYKKLYKIDYYDEKLYDLMIDTTKLSISEVIDKIIKSIK